jgi:large subunit ribosomal protein L32e
MVTMDLLKLKAKMNAKRPQFKHYDAHKRKEVNPAWRKPKGLHNKMRKGVWGRPATVNVGYRSPVAIRNMHRNGLFPVLVNTLSEIAKIDAKAQGALIGHVGGRAKKLLLTECKQKNITVLNVRNVDEELKNIEGKVTARKAARKDLQKRKETKVKPKEAPKEEKKEVLTKEEENKEMQKLVTQRT